MRQRIFSGLMTALLLTGTARVTAQWEGDAIGDDDMAADLEEALTFQKYPTYPLYLEVMRHFAATYPAICRLDTFGRSEQGRLLLALKISDNVQEEEAEADFLYTATMHGNELVGYPLLLRLAGYLLENYGEDVEVDRLVDNLAIWINPLSNPDGTFYPDDNFSVDSSRRENARGIDLNRNYPDPGAGEPDDTTGRERETREMMHFLRERRFTLSANIHSGAEVVNYPWDHTSGLHADNSWFYFVSRDYADEARAADPGYMALFTDGVTNGAEWYIIRGGRQDYVTYYLGGREITLELSESFRLGSEFLEEYWQKNKRSLLNYMAQCMYGIRGRVMDASTGLPVEAQIRIPGHDSAYSVVRSHPLHGDFYRLIDEGVYNLEVTAPGYDTARVEAVGVTRFAATPVEVELVPGDGVPVLTPLAATGFRIYPNPVSGPLTIEALSPLQKPVEVTLWSPDGRMAKREEFRPAPRIRLSLDNLPAGLYVLEVRSGRESRRFRVVRQP